MKHSVFWKIIIGLLVFTSLAECIMMFVLYNVTYNQAIEDATENIRYAASNCASTFEFYDPNDLSDYQDAREFLNNLCNGLDITYLYILKGDLQTRNETYLAAGYGKNASDEYINNRYPGYVAQGKLRNEQIDILHGKEEVMLHEKNQFDDTLICYMPVLRHYDNKNHEFVEEISSMVCAEMSLKSVMENTVRQYTHFIIIDLFVAILLLATTGVILYFRVSKPLKLISKRMKGFVSNRDEFFEKLPVNGKDEIAEVSDSFNTMAQEIDDFIMKLSELNRQRAELNIARSIQRGLLEPQDYLGKNVSITGAMLTAKDVGGDLYDYYVLENGNVFVSIADVSGKGVTGALFMSRAITLLHEYAKLGHSPGEMLHEYNNNLAHHNPNMMFITTFVAIYHPDTGELTFSNAGHNPPYIVSDSLITLDNECGSAAGVFENETYPEYSVHMKPGDRLYMFTDGVTEAQNAEGGFFGEERLENVLRQHRDDNTEALVNAVIEEIKRFSSGAEQTDDITMLALEINPEKDLSLHLEAKTENLEAVNQLISGLEVSEDMRFQLNLIAEEVFVNICSYSYPGSTGDVDISADVREDAVVLTFTDSGIPFNQGKDVINIDDYDMEHAVGGLGRFISFSFADDYSYERQDGKNILTIVKKMADGEEQDNDKKGELV